MVAKNQSQFDITTIQISEAKEKLNEVEEILHEIENEDDNSRVDEAISLLNEVAELSTIAKVNLKLEK